jgi:hypothetical protein
MLFQPGTGTPHPHVDVRQPSRRLHTQRPPRMRLSAALAALAACLAPAAAVFEDDAYHADFHYALLGLPQPEATFFAKPYAGSRASLLYALSRNQTIGAINPKDGALVWRQHFPSAPSRGRGHLRSAHGQDTVVSAVGGRIAAWSASDGRLVWETGSGDATVEDLEMLEHEAAQDALVLLARSTASTVQRLDGKTGRPRWAFEDTRSAKPPLRCRAATDEMTAATRPSSSRHRRRPSTISPCTRHCSAATGSESPP